MTDPIADRCRGALLGLACGDALGTTLEFRAPGTFTPLTGIVGGGPFALAPGRWTDDTSMALCLAESLIATGRLDAVDQLERYVRWWQDGHLSSTGTCFDIGSQTRAALAVFADERSPQPLAADPRRAGNGSIMRLAPVPIAFHRDLDAAIDAAGASSLTTHPAASCVDACRYLGAMTAAAIAGADRATVLAPEFWRWGELHPEIEAIARGSFTRREPPEIRGGGYVVHSLEAALWALHGAGDFAAGALRAVNLGDDADTTGAVYGQLAGALHGAVAIPGKWRDAIYARPLIERFADDLHVLSPAAR